MIVFALGIVAVVVVVGVMCACENIVFFSLFPIVVCYFVVICVYRSVCMCGKSRANGATGQAVTSFVRTCVCD